MSVRRQGYEDLYPLGSSGYGGGHGGYGGGTSISIDLCQVFKTCVSVPIPSIPPQLLALAALAAVAAAAAAALFLAVQGGKRRRRRTADDKNSFVADIFEGKKLKYCFKASRQVELSLMPHQGQT